MNDAYTSNPIRGEVEGDASLDLSLDEGWIGALSRLGRLVMVLHRLATTATANDFQRQAFEALQAELPFDSGIWASGVMNPGPTLHSLFAHKQPPEMMRAWKKLAQHDTVLTETLRRPGHTLRATADGLEGGAPFLPEVSEHAHRYGTEQVLATSYINPLLGLVESFSLYRADRQARFTEPERLLVQHALPHLVEAWRTIRLRLVRHENPPTVPSGRALGICDSKGLLHTAGPDFAALMRQEWTGWCGPTIPQQWLTGGQKPFLGRHIAASLRPINDLWLVQLRRRMPLDSLTAREIDVARRFGLGLNYQEIATELHIAPATVRNHLSNIYSKLDISNKIELAKLFD